MIRSAVVVPSSLLLAIAFLLAPADAEAQIQASPKASISTVIDGTTLEVVYHRPSVRGRALFGELVPWETMWTPGANWATVLRVDRDIRLNGIEVPAGDYSMWMIPRPDRFTLALDPEAERFHSIKPDSNDTQIHIPAEPESTEHTEMLTWRIPAQRGDAAVLEFAWGETSIPFDVVVQPSRPIALEPYERAMYTGTWTLTLDEALAEAYGLPTTAELRIFEENGVLRGELPFPLHPNDELAWDLVPAGRVQADGATEMRFNPGLYRGDTLFNIEIGVNVDFELPNTEDRATAVRFAMPNGMVWAEGERAR